MRKKKKAKKPGRTEDRISYPADWRDAVGKALKKKRPKKGWPKPDTNKED